MHPSDANLLGTSDETPLPTILYFYISYFSVRDPNSLSGIFSPCIKPFIGIRETLTPIKKKEGRRPGAALCGGNMMEIEKKKR